MSGARLYIHFSVSWSQLSFSVGQVESRVRANYNQTRKWRVFRKILEVFQNFRYLSIILHDKFSIQHIHFCIQSNQLPVKKKIISLPPKPQSTEQFKIAHCLQNQLKILINGTCLQTQWNQYQVRFIQFCPPKFKISLQNNWYSGSCCSWTLEISQSHGSVSRQIIKHG